MNRGHVLQSSPYVPQMMAAGSPNNWWSINSMRPSSQPTPSSFLAHPPPLPPNLFPQFIIPPPPPPSSSPCLPLSSSWNDTQELPESWSQLLLGGLVGEEHLLEQNQTGSINGHITPATTFVTIGSSNNMLDFSSKNDARHPPPSHSSECNSTATGGVAKKARVEPSSSTQSTFKVRKEKLGDRITALHQIVSPFGKTDTASVLLEAIGYIRFLHNQIEALSIPYLGNGSGNMRQQQHVQGDRSCLFPEDPGQLLNNDGCNKKKGISDKESDEEAKKDLRSRGLCLVPISCTMQVESDNGADYWAPAAFNGGFR